MAANSIVPDDVKRRYNEKIRDFCAGVDPFTINIEDARDPLPRNVCYIDAYQYYENGWVQSINCKQISGGYILLAKVKHSFRLSLKPVQCFVSVDQKGVILTGHCECMAGLGEVCRHVGAILFVLEAWGSKASEISNSERFIFSREHVIAPPSIKKSSKNLFLSSQSGIDIVH